MEVKAKAKQKDGTERLVTVEYDFGENLDEMLDRFSSEVVYGQALDSLVISVQAMIRRHASGTDKAPPKSDEEIQKIVSAWRPGVGATRKSATEKAADAIRALTPEQRAALLAELRG